MKKVSKIELEESPFVVKVRDPRQVVNFHCDGPKGNFYCWIEHTDADYRPEMQATFKIFETHHPIPNDATHAGSDGKWHLYQMTPWTYVNDFEDPAKWPGN